MGSEMCIRDSSLSSLWEQYAPPCGGSCTIALSVTFGDTSPIGRGFGPRAGGMCSFVFLFVEKCVILVLRPCPPTSIGGEVSFMVHFLAILESVVADVISHYICKWLDRFDKDRKPD